MEHCGKKLLSLIGPHRLRKATTRHVEELLHDLVADDPFPRIKGDVHQLTGNHGFGRRGLVEEVDEKVRIEEKLIAHSSRRECRDRLIVWFFANDRSERWLLQRCRTAW